MRTLPALNPKVESVVPYLFLAGAVFIVYANIYGNSFVGDDDLLIVHNPLLRSWRTLPIVFTKTLAAGCPYYRPLHGLLNLVIYQIAGLSLFAFHVPNVVLHAANAGLVFMLGRKMNFAPVPAFLAALLWTLQPLRVESIAQMSGVADVMYSFFCLLGVLVLFPAFTRRRFWLAVPFMVLALLSKEGAVIFPLLALSCLLYVQSDKRLSVRAWLRVWPLLLTAFVYLIVWLLALYSSFRPSFVSTGNLQPQHFNYAVFATPFYYLKLLLWPVGLHMEHDLPVYTNIWHGDVLAGLTILLLTVVQVLRPQNHRSLPLSWGLCWFVIAQLPTSFFFTIHFYEHWTYLSSAGLMLGAFESATRWLREEWPRAREPLGRIGIAAAVIIAPVFGFLSFKQNELWRDPITMYQNTLRYEGTFPTFHVALGIIYAQRNMLDKAIEQFKFVVDNPSSAALPRDQLANVQAMWGTTLMAMPDGKDHQEEALGHFQSALSIDPDSVMALQSLAHFYMDRGDAVTAAMYSDKAEAARKKSPWPDYVFDSKQE